MPVVARASGDPITAGTVNFYLIADSGTNVGKWFKTSDNSWDAAEQVAGAGTHKADGTWQSSIDAEAWIDQASYTLYAKESGDLHVPLNAKVYCRHAYERQTGDSFARIGAAGAGLTDLGGMSTTMKAQVQAEAQDAIDSQGMSPDQYVLVARAATDADRGTNLAAALITAKTMSPTTTNRIKVIAPDGGYLITTKVDWDTDGIDLEAENVVTPMPRNSSDWDIPNGTDATPLGNYRPTRVSIYATAADVTVFEQSANDCRFRGISWAQLHAAAVGYNAFYCSATDPDPSVYEDCVFFHRLPAAGNRPIVFAENIAGTYRRVTTNSFAFRGPTAEGSDWEFRADMEDVSTGSFSIGGDYVGAVGTKKMTRCRLVRCGSVGRYTIGSEGEGSFNGCSTWGAPIDSTCYFEDCYGGPHCGAPGAENAGTWVRPRFGAGSLAGTMVSAYPGNFSGKCIDGILGPGSAGGRDVSAGANGKLTGTLRNTQIIGSVLPHRVEGATIDGCLMTMGVTDQDCITLLAYSEITNSTLLVVEGGDGVPINAASALSVCAAGNRWNNRGQAADGLGDNVTNVAADLLAAGEHMQVADAWLGRTDGIETGVTPKQAMQRIGASAAGKISGAGSGTETATGLDGSTDRVQITVDASGNRTSVNYDP